GPSVPLAGGGRKEVPHHLLPRGSQAVIGPSKVVVRRFPRMAGAEAGPRLLPREEAPTRRRAAVVMPTAARASRELNTGRRAEAATRSEEHTSELQSRFDIVCRLLLEKKK